MAQNPFSISKEINNKVPRSTHDLSYQSNLTMTFGKLYPVFCKEVLAGDSFRIATTFGLRTLPLVFPTQTRIKARLHYFYVRNRSLWKEWQDFIFDTKKGLTPPYFAKTNKTDMGTCSLADHLGIPSVVFTDEALNVNIPLKPEQYLTIHHSYSEGPSIAQIHPLALPHDLVRLSNGGSKVTYIQSKVTFENPFRCTYEKYNNIAVRIPTTSLRTFSQ